MNLPHWARAGISCHGTALQGTAPRNCAAQQGPRATTGAAAACQRSGTPAGLSSAGRGWPGEESPVEVAPDRGRPAVSKDDGIAAAAFAMWLTKAGGWRDPPGCQRAWPGSPERGLGATAGSSTCHDHAGALVLASWSALDRQVTRHYPVTAAGALMAISQVRSDRIAPRPIR